MNAPDTLEKIRPFDVQPYEGLEIESAFLDFTDRFGRPVSVYAARCYPAITGKKSKPLPLVVHLPGGGQTVFPSDLAFLARHGFAAVSYDWQIGAFNHDPQRKSRWPEGVVNQGNAIEREEEAILPLAIQACGVAIDWMAKAPGGTGAKKVNAKRVGVVGISWGGYLTWGVNAHEPRVAAAVPVYGCGGLWEPGRPLHTQARGAARARWQADWDAGGLAERQIGPVCWISGTNDFFGFHTYANHLLDRVRVDRRRSCDPNNNHHVAQGDSILAVSWLRHHLADGAPVPSEPVLREDLTIEADESQPIAERTLWWTPSRDVPDDYRCWFQTPVDRAAMTQAFGRVRYQSGLTLNTPLREFTPDPTMSRMMPAVWPDARDGTCSHWGLRSTQLHRTDIAVTALPGDPTRSLWVIDRKSEGPLAVSFRGLADPRWNNGSIKTIEIGFDWLGQTATSINAGLEWVLPDGTRGSETIAVKVEPGANRAAVSLRPEMFPKLPANTGWSHVTKIILTGHITTNRFVLGPFSKQTV